MPRLVRRVKGEFDEFGGESLGTLLLSGVSSANVMDRRFFVSGTIGVSGSMPRDFSRK